MSPTAGPSGCGGRSCGRAEIIKRRAPEPEGRAHAFSAYAPARVTCCPQL